MRETLLFDVNETLLDLTPMRAHFERMFGEGVLMAEWFGLLLRQSLVATITRSYRPFDELGRDALRMVAKKQGAVASRKAIRETVDEMLRLPPHSDVVAALSELRDAGVRMATLTNSSMQMQAQQLENAGLSGFFERQFSVEAVKLFKPAPQTYQYAAAQLGVPIGNVRLVAAHDWDVTGAIRAGAKGAFVARKGMVLGEAGEAPDVTGADLPAVVGLLLGRD